MDVVAEVRAVVMAIPSGTVATYGAIGRAVGIGPRQAGRALSLLGEGAPWWRVVYADGKPARCRGGRAQGLLEEEGVPFKNGRVSVGRSSSLEADPAA